MDMSTDKTWGIGCTMKTFFLALCLFACSAHANETPAQSPAIPQSNKPSESDQEGIILFTPPPGWRLADASSLPSHVRAMVVGNGPSAFPPSMNLSWEPYKGTLRQYLKSVKIMNDSQGYDWKDLGSIKTEAGNGSLSQVDTKTQWGDVRLMHVILINNGNVYILTASALKDEFSLFYKEFFASMRSLRIAQDLYDMVVDPQQRSQLKAAVASVQKHWESLLKKKEQENPEMNGKDLQETVFKSDAFQNDDWKPLQEMLKQKYGNFGAEWQTLFLKKFEDRLLNANNVKS